MIYSTISVSVYAVCVECGSREVNYRGISDGGGKWCIRCKKDGKWCTRCKKEVKTIVAPELMEGIRGVEGEVVRVINESSQYPV